MTRTTSCAGAVLLHRRDRNGEHVRLLLVDDLDRDRGAVGRAEIADLDLALVDLLLRCRPGVDASSDVRFESSSEIVPGSSLTPPTSSTVQCWPTFSLVRSDADACSVTVKFGSVSDSIGVPGGSGSPSFTNTCPMRIGQFADDHVGRLEHHVLLDRTQRHGDRGLARRAAARCRAAARSPGRAARCRSPGS